MLAIGGVAYILYSIVELFAKELRASSICHAIEKQIETDATVS
jgi:hypothetical protein